MKIRSGRLYATIILFLWLGFTVHASPSDPLDPHFKFLYQLLKDNYDEYSSYIFKTTSAILLMIGWFMTSKDARAYIATRSRAKVFILAGIGFFIGAEIIFSLGARCTSLKIVQLLQKTETISANHDIAAYLEPKIVPLHGITMFIAAHCVLYFILATIVWPMPNTADDSGSKS
jgi:hypothetical protein